MGRISMPQGKGSLLHNRRDYDKIGKPLPSNINPALTAENIVLVDKNIKDAYHDIFGDAVTEYNAKQKRADRKIDDYYTHIQKSKNGEKIFYEDVLQWGAKSDFEHPETRQKAAEALKAYVSTFEQRNPNLRLVGAYIHMDEASPHLHLDYIPVASGYKRGMAVRNSLDRAMKQMGYQLENESRKNNATKLWKEHERAVFGDICRDMGLEVEEERKARGSLSVAEYKDARDAMISGIEQEKQALTEEITPLRQLKVNADRVSGTTRTIFPGVVAIKSGDLNLLEMQARSYAINRDEIKSLRDRAADVSKREKQTDLREQQLKVRESDVERMYNRQISLNQHLEKSENQVKQLKDQNADLKTENDSLKTYTKKLFSGLDSAKKSLANIDEREKRVDQWEQQLKVRESDVERITHDQQTSFNRLLKESEDQVKQLQVQNADLKSENRSLKDQVKQLRVQNTDLKTENNSLKTKIGSLETKIGSLNAEIDDLWDMIHNTIKTLTERFIGAVEHLGAICKAVGMLKYSDGIYRADLTIDQGRLVDAVLNYGSKYARSIDEQDIADDINQNAMISSDINQEIKDLEPRYWNL